jgi:hypothetical protein
MIVFLKKISVLATPVFDCVISIDQFESVCKFMRFNNNDSKDTYLSPPKLFKIYPLMSYLNRKFQNLYIPDQNIATNDSFDTMVRKAFIHTIHSVEAIKIWNSVL